jgi:hypothetical protein
LPPTTQTLQLNKLAHAVQVKQWQANPGRYFEDCLTITPKVGDNIKLVQNTHQRKVQEAINKQRALGKPVRIKILKPRQTGISTNSLANLFHAVRFGRGVGMVVSKDGDSTTHLFGMAQKFYAYLPESEKKVLPADKDNRKGLKIAEPHGGHIIVQTAGAKTGAGHSFTIRYLVLSEVSRWPDGSENTIDGLLNAVPRDPDTMVIIESIANGMSGWFCDKWYEDNDYERVFLGSQEHEEYRKELPIVEGRYIAQLTDEEKQLMSQYDLSLDQVEFRRWAIRENCRGSSEVFNEQYPYDADKAFLASGSSFFHIPTVDAIQCSQPLVAELQLRKDIAGRTEIFPLESTRGRFSIWKRPQKGMSYVMGGDPAEGIEIKGAPEDDKHDYSSAHVAERETGEIVATFHARVTPDEFGRSLKLLGNYYNQCFVCVETTGGYGGETIRTMLDDNRAGEDGQRAYPQHLLYRNPNNPNELGFKTTKANRKPIMTNLDMALRSHDIHLHCEGTKRELKSFITKPDGKIEHGQGKKDDRVFSLALATKMLEVAPVFAPANTGTGAPVLGSFKYRTTRTLVPRPARSPETRKPPVYI